MLGNRISELRRAKGMGQAQLARSLNVSASTVGMYEQGRRIPSIDILIQLSRIFDVSLDYLVTGVEHRPSKSAPAVRLPDDCPCSSCYWKKYRII